MFHQKEQQTIELKETPHQRELQIIHWTCLKTSSTTTIPRDIIKDVVASLYFTILWIINDWSKYDR
jgi:hypothetical protein